MKKTWNIDAIGRSRGVIMGIATLLISFYHSRITFTPLQLYGGRIGTLLAGLLTVLHENSGLGVELFLLMSGVGLYYSLEKDGDLKRFYKKRAVRILPPFLIVSSIWTAMQSSGGLRTYLAKTFLITLYTQGERVSWYISLILLLYAVYPLIHKVVRRWGLGGSIGLSLTAYGTSVLLFFLAPTVFGNLFILIHRIPLFVMGVWFGKLNLEKKQISVIWIWIAAGVLLLSLLPSLYMTFTARVFTWRGVDIATFLPMSLSLTILFSAFFSRFSLPSLRAVLQWIGLYSLEMYLLFEKIRKLGETVFLSDDMFHLSYYIPVFVVTVVLSIGLKAVCSVMDRTLFSAQKDKLSHS